MKLPSLNIDLSVNTATFSKKLSQASQDLQKFGAKAATIGGADLPGPLGRIAKLGGTSGGIASAASLFLGGVQLPFKMADALLNAFGDSVKTATGVMEKFNAGQPLGATGLNPFLAANLAAAAGKQDIAAARQLGLTETFFGAATDEFGNAGGVIGFLMDWAASIRENAKFAVGFAGAALAGYGGDEALARAEIGVSPSYGASQAYMTTDEVNRLGKGHEKFRKQYREQNT